jgi:hypothetical protein
MEYRVVDQQLEQIWRMAAVQRAPAKKRKPGCKSKVRFVISTRSMAGKPKGFPARHPRLKVYSVPTRVPELDPTEFVWTRIGEYTASTAPDDRAEHRVNMFAAVTRTRRSQKHVWARVFASGLPWVR